MAKNKSIVTRLGGGGRTDGDVSQVVNRVLANPDLFPELVFGMWHVEPNVRTRVADALEKVTAKRPELLQPFKTDLLTLAPHARPAAMRWHMAQLIPRLDLNEAERDRMMDLLRDYLDDESSLVKTFAMDSLANLAAACDDKVRREVTKTIRGLEKTGTPSMKARARKILARA